LYFFDFFVLFVEDLCFEDFVALFCFVDLLFAEREAAAA
jgi:hypothetical protein